MPHVRRNEEMASMKRAVPTSANPPLLDGKFWAVLIDGNSSE